MSEVMELKVGGVYKARNGDRSEIVECVHSYKPYFVDKSGECYWPNGSQDYTLESPHDLVAEWQDEPTIGEPREFWVGSGYAFGSEVDARLADVYDAVHVREVLA